MTACLDCPHLGDFSGRPTPRATCCMDANRDRLRMADRASAAREVELAAAPSRQVRRNMKRLARKTGRSSAQ